VTGTDDPALVAPYAQPVRLDHGARATLCVVLFHGLTNNPAQFSELAPMIFARGANVLVPRMPFHGYADRMTGALANLTARGLIAAANEAVETAKTLGERVAVLGISMGGLLCAQIAQQRDDVDLSIPIAPDFGLLRFPRSLSSCLERVLLALPNVFLWWDPRVREKMLPDTAYPRFATHALMQTLRIGDAVYRAAKNDVPAARRITMVVNPRDPAVNDAVARSVVQRWQRSRRDGITCVELQGLAANHDIIDPRNPMQQTALVYPKLIELLGLHS
jgi:alpha-beta hydrolase superfamily lysophospholipase